MSSEIHARLTHAAETAAGMLSLITREPSHGAESEQSSVIMAVRNKESQNGHYGESHLTDYH